MASATHATVLRGTDVRCTPCLPLRCGCSGELKAPWSNQVVKKPVVSVTDETGNKADVTLFNIWAGKVRLLQLTTRSGAAARAGCVALQAAGSC